MRILPPYWAAIIALVALSFLLIHFGIPLPPGITPSALAMEQLLRQWFLIFAGGNQAITDPFWTLPIEFQWYFLFPLLLWLWMRSPRAFGWSVLGLFAVGVFMRLLSGPLPYLLAFAAGIVAAEIRVRKLRLGVLGPTALVLFVVLGVATSYNGHWPQTWNPMWQFAAFFAVVCAGEFSALERALGLNVMAFLGLASYSIYLVRLPALSIAEHFGANALVAAIVGVCAGIGFWYLAERPFTETAVRDRLLAFLTAALRRCAPIQQRSGVA